MTGRVMVILLLGAAAVAGAGMYYLQVYHFYEEIPADVAEVKLTTLDGREAQAVMFENYEGIDATSSPIRYRACFDLGSGAAALAGIYATYPAAEPLVGPGWFDCYDAQAVGADLEDGRAVAFLGVENTEYGVDRVVAVYPDGAAVSWDQLNRCGEVVFDGDPAPEGCPPAPEAYQ